MNNEFNPCLLIPCFEKHALTLKENCIDFLSLKLPIILVDDGSSPKYRKVIEDIASESELITLFRSKENLGKGSAVKLAALNAYSMGYTHGVQIDSDGQHDFSSAHLLIEESKKFPRTLVSGKPIYGEDIPTSRKYGRYITHFWVWVETLSLSIKDSMCGFRSYPLKEMNNVLESQTIGNRMDFDTEIMVKMFWSGVNVRSLDVSVIYPEHNTSYFYAFSDNVLISWMHTKLFFGMLIRSPRLLFRKTDTDWFNQKEKGFESLMLFSLWVKRNLPSFVVKLLISLISFYYYIFSSKSRRNSSVFFKKNSAHCLKNNLSPVQHSSYKHIHSFADSISDKFSVWDGTINRNNLCPDSVEKFYSYMPKNTGAIYISSHYGNIEVIRAVGSTDSNIKFFALMLTKQAGKIFSVLNKINPRMKLGIISTDDIDMTFVQKMSDILNKNGNVFCMGDRLLPGSDKNVTGSFLGSEVSLPIGPFLFGHLFNVPVFSCHCYKVGKFFKIKVTKISPDIAKKEINKIKYIETVSANYLTDLEELVCADPYQWYNFNNFWKDNE